MIADINEDSGIVWVKYTRQGYPPKHNIWRLKDEQYRVNGRDAFGGWMWVSVAFTRKYVATPTKPPIGITYQSSRESIRTVSAEKAFKLDKLVSSLYTWRTLNERLTLGQQKSKMCYSISCQTITSGKLAALKAASVNSKGEFLPCYSPTCALRFPNAYGKLSSCINSKRIFF